MPHDAERLARAEQRDALTDAEWDARAAALGEADLRQMADRRAWSDLAHARPLDVRVALAREVLLVRADLADARAELIRLRAHAAEAEERCGRLLDQRREAEAALAKCQVVCVGLADRVAAQSELLSKRAEAPVRPAASGGTSSRPGNFVRVDLDEKETTDG